VTGAHLTATANVTGNNTNNAQFLLQRVRSGTPATIATLTLVATTGDLVVDVPKSMGSLTNTALLAGDVLKLVVTENGDGLITPNATISVTVENTLATA
jgi:phage terminase large subunit GpA-like protein